MFQRDESFGGIFLPICDDDPFSFDEEAATSADDEKMSPFCGDKRCPESTSSFFVFFPPIC